MCWKYKLPRLGHRAVLNLLVTKIELTHSLPIICNKICPPRPLPLIIINRQILTLVLSNFIINREKPTVFYLFELHINIIRGPLFDINHSLGFSFVFQQSSLPCSMYRNTSYLLPRVKFTKISRHPAHYFFHERLSKIAFSTTFALDILAIQKIRNILRCSSVASNLFHITFCLNMPELNK